MDVDEGSTNMLRTDVEQALARREMARIYPTGSMIKRTYDHVLEVSSALASLSIRAAPRQNKKKAPSLLALPLELKYDIFDLILKPNNVYVRWSARAASHDVRFADVLEAWDGDSTPVRWLPQLPSSRPSPAKPSTAETQLFLVNKQLRDEAMQFYLASNTFHLMGLDTSLPFLS